MNETSPTGVKRGGEMAEGFILDKLDNNAAVACGCLASYAR
jgi:hypothetical protein